MEQYILLLIVVIEASYLNQPCKHQPCLPNADALNRGFDIVNGNQYKGDVLGLKWSRDEYYQNPNDGIYYQIPEGATVGSMSVTTDYEGYVIFRNLTQASKWQAYQMTDTYRLGMCSHTYMSNQSMTSIYEQTRNVAYVLKTQKNYYIVVPPSQLTFSPECQKNLDLLPDEYNPILYRQFINAFGTDVATYTEWGLRYTFASNIKECYVSQTTTTETENQVRTNAWIASNGHTEYTGSSQTSTYYQSRTITSESFQGGNVNCHSSSEWNCWWQSGILMVDPVIVTRSTIPIYTLINDTNKRANMMRAYNEYLQQSYELQNYVVEQKILQPHHVSYALVGGLVVNGVINTIYYTPSTTVQLAANQSGPITGTDGPCNNLTHESYLEFCGNGKTCNREVQYPNLHYCKRSIDGSLTAQLFFDQNRWVNSVRNTGDVCTNVNVNITTKQNAYTAKIFDWNHSNGKYYGMETDVENPYGFPLSSIASQVYVTSYVYGKDINQYRSYDGLSVSNGYSMSSTFDHLFVCYMDCDHVSVYYEPPYGAVVDVVCDC